jgi:hypothetical protein
VAEKRFRTRSAQKVRDFPYMIEKRIMGLCLRRSQDPPLSGLMKTNLVLGSRTFLLALLGAATSVVACSSGQETTNASSSSVSATGIDAQIRADLKLALGAGARCHPADAACRSSVLERMARGDRSDPVLAQVIDRVNRLNRADFCEQLDPNAGAVFAVGADSAAASNEVAVLFDLQRFAAAVMTSADGLADLQQGAAYETIAKANGEFPGVWAGGFATAEATLPLAEATLHWSGAGGIAGALKLAAKQEETRLALASVSSVDGSKYGFAPTVSATSAIVMAKAFESIGARRDGALVSFTSKAKHRPGAATAIAIAQIAGLDGMGSRAAAMAITFDRAASFAGGVAAYCGKGNAALTTRSFGNVGTRNDDGSGIDFDISLGTGFGGLEDRNGSSGENEGLDCSSGLAELECGALYGSNTFCSFNGKGSCCRAPITDTSKLQPCTPGPDSKCAGGEVCTRAAESGPNANQYVCLGTDTCQAFTGTSEPLPEQQTTCTGAGQTCSIGKRCCGSNVCAIGGEREDPSCRAFDRSEWLDACTQGRKGAAVYYGSTICRRLNGEEMNSLCMDVKGSSCVIGYNGDCGSGAYTIRISDLAVVSRDLCPM